MCMFGFHITKIMKIQSETTFLPNIYLPVLGLLKNICLFVLYCYSLLRLRLQCVSVYLHLTIIHIHVHFLFQDPGQWVYTCLSQVSVETLPAN